MKFVLRAVVVDDDLILQPPECVLLLLLLKPVLRPFVVRIVVHVGAALAVWRRSVLMCGAHLRAPAGRMEEGVH